MGNAPQPSLNGHSGETCPAGRRRVAGALASAALCPLSQSLWFELCGLGIRADRLGVRVLRPDGLAYRLGFLDALWTLLERQPQRAAGDYDADTLARWLLRGLPFGAAHPWAGKALRWDTYRIDDDPISRQAVRRYWESEEYTRRQRLADLRAQPDWNPRRGPGWNCGYYDRRLQTRVEQPPSKDRRRG